jgi:hypothetical protein
MNFGQSSIFQAFQIEHLIPLEVDFIVKKIGSAWLN